MRGPFPYIAGTAGTKHYNPAIGMSTDGSFIVAWTQDNLEGDGQTVGNSNLFFSTYSESTDSVGPTVAALNTPDGQYAGPNNGPNGGPSNLTVTNPVQHLVITMDEAMYDNPTHTGDAVSNPANYALIKNGVPMVGVITQVQYGLDEAANLANMNPTLYSDLSTVPTDHYEIVLTIDTSGTAAKHVGLGTGNYTVQLVAPATPAGSTVQGHGLRNAGGAPLNLTGFNDVAENNTPGTLNPNGSNASVNFSLYVTGNSPTNPVNGGGQGLVSNDPYDPSYTAAEAQAVASDAAGDFVVAWQDTTSGHVGVWVKMYQQTLHGLRWRAHSSVAEYPAINPATGMAWPNNEILITTDPDGHRRFRRLQRRRQLRRHLVRLQRHTGQLERVGRAVQRHRPAGGQGLRGQYAAARAATRTWPWTPRATSSSPGSSQATSSGAYTASTSRPTIRPATHAGSQTLVNDPSRHRQPDVRRRGHGRCGRFRRHLDRLRPTKAAA